MIIGIDLGTTNSLVGTWRDGTAELIPNAVGTLLTPSAVSVLGDGSVVVGLPARERLLSHPAQSVGSFKRFMGTNRQFDLGSVSFRAEELSALVLRSLKADAEAYLNETISEAIVTVPAHFNDAQRKATKAAAEIAGLKVERLLNEPTAAAMAYGLQDKEGERKILVLDLGGGTFDVSVLEMFEGVMEVRASAGDNFLGGEDFVDLIVDRFIADVGAAAGMPLRSHAGQTHASLRRQAELAKRALSVQDRYELELPHQDTILRWTITREQFETLAAPLARRLSTPIERAIRDSNLHPDQITDLVLAGGATRMPLVRKLAARLFQRLPIATIDPDEVVARGAAVQAGLKMRDAALDEIVMTDVAPFTMGMEVVNVRSGAIVMTGLYLPVIERNTVIPTSRSKTVQTTTDGQRAIPIRIFQGESRLVRDNIELGHLSVPVPAGPIGKETVDVRFTYDVSGLLEIDARVNSTGDKAHLVIEGNPGILSPDDIAARLAALEALKIHPRDQQVNRAVLARAERLYEERLGEERTIVGRAIDEFRTVLNSQDEAAIRTYREAFVQWLDRADTSFFS